MEQRLKAVGLAWATLHLLRRRVPAPATTRESTKVAADQRGHAIGVAIEVYAKAAL